MDWQGHLIGRIDVYHFPNLGCMIGGACCELLDVRREEDPRNVLLVRRELRHRHELSVLEVLDKCPHKNVAL